MKLMGNNVSNTIYIGSERPFTLADKKKLDSASEAAHTHSNKDALDGITAKNVEQWSKAEANVQSDWLQIDTSADDYIKNKPDLTLKEDNENKVTAISANSTDMEYPSAKAVYDYLANNYYDKSDVEGGFNSLSEAVSEKENIGNKITTISTLSSDEKYPSEKAVYTFVNNKISDALSEKPEKMRLLNSVTLSEAVGSIEFTQTDSGILYADIPLKNVIIHTVVKNANHTDGAIASDTYIRAHCVSSDTRRANICYGGNITTDNIQTYSRAELYSETKKIITIGPTTDGYAASFVFNSQLSYDGALLAYLSNGGKNPIDVIEWSAITEGAVIPMGSTIQIWGCK